MISRAAGLVAILAPISLMGCDLPPISPERAYEICSEEARRAAGPTGSVGLGVGSSGVTGNFEVTVTDDFIRGRDPQVVYDSCFRRRTGAGPTRPLIL